MDKNESGSLMPPRRDPFRQKIWDKEDLKKEEAEKRARQVKEEALRIEARAVDLEVREQELFQELKVLYQKRMQIDRSLSSDRHRQVNRITSEIDQLEKERLAVKQQIEEIKLQASEVAKPIEKIEQEIREDDWLLG